MKDRPGVRARAMEIWIQILLCRSLFCGLGKPSEVGLALLNSSWGRVKALLSASHLGSLCVKRGERALLEGHRAGEHRARNRRAPGTSPVTLVPQTALWQSCHLAFLAPTASLSRPGNALPVLLPPILRKKDKLTPTWQKMCLFNPNQFLPLACSEAIRAGTRAVEVGSRVGVGGMWRSRTARNGHLK